MAVNLHLPVFQRFDCHSCGYCCRNLVVNVTTAERRRILDAGWATRITDHPLFVSYRFRGRRFTRLAHRPDGRCVFLGTDERCRLHAETGVDSKPLPCRLYPFVPTPGVDDVRLDLRFDCPSVASNKGRGMSAQLTVLRRLAGEVHATPMRRVPGWPGIGSLDISEWHDLTGVFQRLLETSDLPPRSRWLAAGRLHALLAEATLDRVRGPRFAELLDLLATASIQDAAEPADGSAPPPSARPLRLFREWLFLHALSDDPEMLRASIFTRWRRSLRRYAQARRFAAAAGEIPRLHPSWAALAFEQVRAVRPAPDDSLEPLLRSMRIKLDSHAFAGEGYFGADALCGLAALLLLPALVGWFARFEAAAAGRDAIAAEDLLAGLRQAHHTFGVSPVFSRFSERWRLKALAAPGVVLSLQHRYGP